MTCSLWVFFLLSYKIRGGGWCSWNNTSAQSQSKGDLSQPMLHSNGISYEPPKEVVRTTWFVGAETNNVSTLADLMKTQLGLKLCLSLCVNKWPWEQNQCAICFCPLIDKNDVCMEHCIHAYNNASHLKPVYTTTVFNATTQLLKFVDKKWIRMREAKGVAVIRRPLSLSSCRSGRQFRWAHSPHSPRWQQGREGNGSRGEWHPPPPAPRTAAVCEWSSPTRGWQTHSDL